MFSITKSQIECYKIRHTSGMYWADITLDYSEGKGRISIASDYGSWNNHWGACGSSFKEFLTKLEFHYIAEKFGVRDKFDFDKTIKAYKLFVIESRRGNQIEAGKARDIWDEIDSLSDYSDCSKDTFCALMWDKPSLMNYFHNCPEICTKINPQFKSFWDKAWPVFIEQIKSEQTEVIS